MKRIELFNLYREYLLEYGCSDVYIIRVHCLTMNDLRVVEGLRCSKRLIVFTQQHYSRHWAGVDYVFLARGSKYLTNLLLSCQTSGGVDIVSLEEVKFNSNRIEYYHELLDHGCFFADPGIHDFMRSIGFKVPNMCMCWYRRWRRLDPLSKVWILFGLVIPMIINVLIWVLYL